MKLILENWNKYLNEESIDESFAWQKHFNISDEERAQMSPEEQKAKRKEFRKIRKAAKAEKTQQPETSAPAEQDQQPETSAPAEQEVSKLAAPLVSFGKQFLQSPIASLAPEAKESMQAMMGYLPQSTATEYENSDVKVSIPPFIDRLLQAAAQYAKKYYAEGDEAAGQNYMQIRGFLEGPANEMLSQYDETQIPSINLWMDDFDPGSHKAVGQSVPAEYSTGTRASKKVLSMGRYGTWGRAGSIGILASV